MMKLDNVIFGLLIALILFIISALLCEFTGYEPCNKLYQVTETEKSEFKTFVMAYYLQIK